MSVIAYRKDPDYFLKYFLVNFIFFAVADGLLLHYRGVSFSFALLHPALPLLILAGAGFGLVLATAFHNASHGNIRPRWLNVALGEFSGAYTLEGMRTFRVGHQLHHMYADNPERDPHPPAKGQSFLSFLQTSHANTIECLKQEYHRYHGDGPETLRNVSLQLWLFHAGTIFKIAFWFLLFGVSGFCLFYVPSFLGYFLGFGHLNYLSHRPDADGVVRIKNHETGWYYRGMNLITSGGYFHGNHHRFPGLYNPSRLPERLQR